jgi:hypothetical protein
MRFWLAALLLAASMVAQAGGLTVSVRGIATDFTPFTVVADAGERIRLPVIAGNIAGAQWLPAADVEADVGRDALMITAPGKPGFYPLTLALADGDSLAVQLFVKVPVSDMVSGSLNGYQIGPPPPGSRRGGGRYTPPTGFIEVTETLLDTALSPHFTLRQFLCKQESDYPKYIALRESLLVLLEGVLRDVRSRGHDVRTFGVISGYRTPWYNRRIGNVPNSRHVYGDAMDIYVDEDRDGRMDDLNGNGIHGRGDIELLAEIATDFMARPENAALRGGIGRYRRTSRHGGFVHVDTRGVRARW